MLKHKDIILLRVIDARKEPLAGEDAWQILAAAREIHVARGSKYLTFDPHTNSREDILRQTLGRTGNLRAPTLLVGDRLLVGFNESLYGLL